MREIETYAEAKRLHRSLTIVSGIVVVLSLVELAFALYMNKPHMIYIAVFLVIATTALLLDVYYGYTDQHGGKR